MYEIMSVIRLPEDMLLIEEKLLNIFLLKFSCITPAHVKEKKRETPIR